MRGVNGGMAPLLGRGAGEPGVQGSVPNQAALAQLPCEPGLLPHLACFPATAMLGDTMALCAIRAIIVRQETGQARPSVKYPKPSSFITGPAHPSHLFSCIMSAALAGSLAL